LYLENNLTADAFTSARVEMMRVLSTTAAISLEKARLYDEMKQEVSRRRQAEGALREREARLRTMANAAPVMIWIAGPDAGLSFFNEQCLHFTGRSMEQMTGEGWIEDVHAEDRVVCTEAYLKAFQARETFQMEYRVRRADGVYRWIEDRGVPLNGPDGSFRGYVGSCVDITERRRGEQMLRTVTEGTASVTGSDFFSLLVRHLALALSVSHAFVAECRDGRRARSGPGAAERERETSSRSESETSPVPRASSESRQGRDTCNPHSRNMISACRGLPTEEPPASLSR